MKGKRGLTEQVTFWAVVAVVIVVVMLAGYAILTGKGVNAIEFIKNIFRFGR